MFEQIIDKQKLSRMMDRSERIYLKKERTTRETKISVFLCAVCCHVVAAYALKVFAITSKARHRSLPT